MPISGNNAERCSVHSTAVDERVVAVFDRTEKRRDGNRGADCVEQLAFLENNFLARVEVGRHGTIWNAQILDVYIRDDFLDRVDDPLTLDKIAFAQRYVQK